MFFQDASTSSHGLHQPSFRELSRHIQTQTLPDMPLPSMLCLIFTSPVQRQQYQPHQQTQQQNKPTTLTPTTWQGSPVTHLPGHSTLKPIIDVAKNVGHWHYNPNFKHHSPHHSRCLATCINNTEAAPTYVIPTSRRSPPPHTTT
eukprot:15361977-Ditylum_brightwellii.AAC.3